MDEGVSSIVLQEPKKHEYRNYVDSKRQEVISETYRLHHFSQTFDLVQQMKKNI